ncbi:MAG: hypothetical protein ACRD8W_00420 [Nitrososphaeraceae archaeon]
MKTLQQVIEEELFRIDPQETGIPTKAELLAQVVANFFSEIFVQWASDPLGVIREYE